MPEWSEPVRGTGSAHDFNTEAVLVATFQRSEQVDVKDFNDPSKLVARTIHRFLDEHSVPVDVWGSADLDGKLRGIRPGTLVRIVFLGSEDLDGGKTIKRFTVQYDTSGGVKDDPVMVSSDDDIPF